MADLEIAVLRIRIRDPVFFLTPGSPIRAGDISGYGAGMNIPDHFSESLQTDYWVKNG